MAGLWCGVASQWFFRRPTSSRCLYAISEPAAEDQSRHFARNARPRYLPRQFQRVAAQQPRQIFLSRAFIRASSALIVSTYLPPSVFDAGSLAGTAAIGFATAGLDTGEALS